MIEYTVRVYEELYAEWFFDGKLHREDGPAIEYANGDKLWYLHGKPHRVDGPAFEGSDGSKEWWVNGQRHREDGPAIEDSDGEKFWYIDGMNLTEEQFNSRTNSVPASCSGKVVEIEGIKYRLTEV